MIDTRVETTPKSSLNSLLVSKKSLISQDSQKSSLLNDLNLNKSRNEEFAKTVKNLSKKCQIHFKNIEIQCV